MKTTLALIGPSDSMKVMCESVKRFFPDLAYKTYIRERTEDSHEVLEQSQQECDGLLFSGIGVQEAARSKGVLTKPHAQISRGAYSLMRVLSEIQRKGIPFKRISIDVVTHQILKEVTREFGISFETVRSMPFDAQKPEQAYLNWHKTLLKKGEVDLAVSGFGSVYQQLAADKHQVFRMLPSSLQVRETVERLLTEIATRDLRSAGIAIQIIRLHSNEEQSASPYIRMKDEGRFFLELLDYVRTIQGSLFNIGKREYVLFSTRGVIESPAHLEIFTRLLQWGRDNNIRVSSGIGIGSTAFEAEKAAQKALSHSKKIAEGAVFLMHVDQIQGPIGEQQELHYRTRIEDKTLLRIAKEIGITPRSVDRVRAIMDKTGKNTFDASDLAACLGIGERSARRILKRFLDSGYATLVGKENAHQVGRPKNMVKITI